MGMLCSNRGPNGSIVTLRQLSVVPCCASSRSVASGQAAAAGQERCSCTMPLRALPWPPGVLPWRDAALSCRSLLREVLVGVPPLARNRLVRLPQNGGKRVRTVNTGPCGAGHGGPTCPQPGQRQASCCVPPKRAPGIASTKGLLLLLMPASVSDTSGAGLHPPACAAAPSALTV